MGAAAADPEQDEERLSFMRLVRLETCGDVVDLLHKPRALLFAVLLGIAVGAGEAMIAVEPVDNLERAVDRLEVALLHAVDQLEDHAVEPGNLQPGEFLGRGDPEPAQLVAQDFFGSLAGELLRGADLVEAGAADQRSENALGAGRRRGLWQWRWACVGHWRLLGVLRSAHGQSAAGSRGGAKFRRSGKDSRCAGRASRHCSTMPRPASKRKLLFSFCSGQRFWGGIRQLNQCITEEQRGLAIMPKLMDRRPLSIMRFATNKTLTISDIPHTMRLWMSPAMNHGQPSAKRARSGVTALRFRI